MQRGALESGLPSRPLDASRRLPIQTTSAVVAVDTPLKTDLFRESQTPAFLLHRVVAARVLRNQMICRLFRMESICSGAILNEWFRASPMISSDCSTKRFLAISVNRATGPEWQTVADWGSKVEGHSTFISARKQDAMWGSLSKPSPSCEYSDNQGGRLHVWRA
jgi:hypothetical protein